MPDSPNLPPAVQSQADQVRTRFVQGEMTRLATEGQVEVDRQMMHSGRDPEATIAFSLNIQPNIMQTINRMVGSVDLVGLLFGRNTGGRSR